MNKIERKGAMDATKIVYLVVGLVIAGVIVANNVTAIFDPLFNVDTTNGTPAWVVATLITVIGAVLVFAFLKLVPKG